MNLSSPTCSILIATYNWPEALELCIRSIWKQSVLPIEIIVCDDGSGSDTANCLRQLQQESPIPIHHVWQEDNGYQAGRIINKGAALAKGEYLVQTDADMILHKHFIKDHLEHATENIFYCGNRYYLNESVTRTLLASKQTEVPVMLKFSKNMWRRWRIGFLQKVMVRLYRIKNMHTYVASCNMAYWKKDFVTVNGYDESFTGWGFEDTELALRMMNKGIQLRFIRLGAVAYHLYHDMASRHNVTVNYSKALKTYETKRVHCESGVDQYL